MENKFADINHKLLFPVKVKSGFGLCICVCLRMYLCAMISDKSQMSMPIYVQ